MLYELRTRFSIPNADVNNMGRADRMLEWLNASLSTGATMGADVAPPRWLGNRYTDEPVTFELATYYRNVFAATADQLRILEIWNGRPAAFAEGSEPQSEVMRVYGDAELANIADPTKKTSHPC